MTTNEHADVIIIGSGPAGAAFARSVADAWPTARIVMVEAGPQISSPPGNHVFNLAEPAQQRAAELASQGPLAGTPYAPITEAEWHERIGGRPDAAMLRRPGLFAVGRGEPAGDGFPAAHGASNVGGMGAHWFGGCPRPALGERPPFLDAATLDAALDDATSMLRSAADQYPNSPIAPILEQRLGELFNPGRPADRLVQPMPMALQRQPSGAFVKTGPDIMLGDLLTAGVERFELLAETICRRVLYSGRKAVGVEVVDARSGVTRQIDANAVAIAADSLHSPQLLHASGIRPAALGHYLNEHLQVGLMIELDGGPASSEPTGVTWVPCDEGFPFSITITQAVPAMLPFGPGGADPASRILFVSLFAAMDLQFDNQVGFSESELDWRGLPALVPHMQPSADELSRVELAKSVVARIAAALGRPVPGVSFMRPPYGSSLHYQGTVRMGASDDGTSVCDAQSRVWGFDNLYVAGNGVIPTVTATNPTLTSVALAILAGRAAAASQVA